MKRGIVRGGFALITAVVISAAILATIVGIATLTVRETRVQAEQNASDQALVVAERGLADVVSRLKTDLAIEAIARPKDVTWEPPLSIDSDGTKVSTVKTGAHSFCWVKVVPTGAANQDRNYEIYAAGFIVRPDISSSASSYLTATLAISTTDVIARRVVQLTSFGKMLTSSTTTKPDGPSAFDYGLFTGANFTMSGSKNLLNVTTSETSGIYAVGNIEPVTGSPTFTDLQLYAEGSIDKDVAQKMLVDSSEVYPGYTVSPKPTFPDLNLEAYMDLFDAFVADPAKAPFDGSKTGYPDLSNASVRSAVLTALGNPQNNWVTVGGHHFVTPDKLSVYTDLVVNGTLPGLSSDPVVLSQQKSALKSTLSKSVFYVRNSVTDPDVTWQSARAYLAGVIVCSGNIKFTGCPDFAQGQVAAFLARGTIDLAGSTAANTPARGIFYAEGWDESKQKFVDKAILYTGSGWFEGQVISKSTVDWAGSGNIKFTDYSSMISDLLPDAITTTEITGFKSFSQTASGWTEKAWADFLNPS